MKSNTRSEEQLQQEAEQINTTLVGGRISAAIISPDRKKVGFYVDFGTKGKRFVVWTSAPLEISEGGREPSRSRPR